MTAEISSHENWKEKILILTAMDYCDQQLLEEIAKTERYISIKRDPCTKVILQLGIPLFSRNISYSSKPYTREQRRAGW